MEKGETNNFRLMTDQEIANAVLQAISDIRKSYYKYGEITIMVSGGTVKHINVLKPLVIPQKE